MLEEGGLASLNCGGFEKKADGLDQREKEDEMTSFLDSHQSAAAENKKLRFETSHEPILVIL